MNRNKSLKDCSKCRSVEYYFIVENINVFWKKVTLGNRILIVSINILHHPNVLNIHWGVSYQRIKIIPLIFLMYSCRDR